MKIILILTGVLFFYALASTLESYDSKSKFDYCMANGLDSVITDMEIQILVEYCEIRTGYQNETI